MTMDENLGLLHGRYRIGISQPLSHLDSGENRAYHVEDTRDGSSHLYALIQNSGVVYRDELVQDIMKKSPPGLLPLQSHGIVKFDDLDYRYVFVFEQPKGGPVYTDGQGPIPENVLLGKVVPRLVDLLIDFSKRKLSHRGIRAGNVFYMEPGESGVALGDCITTPAGALQPAVYEPVESANALADGRGDGDIMYDIYALGVMIVHMLGGVLPGEGRSREELYAAKLQHGSYAVLVPKIPASTRVGFLLAGMLNDDPSRRWNVDVLKRWRDGVYERPRPGFGDRQAPGPVVFEEQEYVSPRLLSLAMTQRPAQAFTLMENGKLESWVRNSLGDKEAASRMSDISVRGAGGGRGRQGDTQSVSKACAILDGEGSFWYREVTFSRGGFPSLVAYAFRAGGGIKNSIGELLENGTLLDAVYSDSMAKPAALGLMPGKKKENWLKINLATDCFEFMEKREVVGYGLERCLYELNQQLPCVAPVFEGAFVRDIETLVDVLEARAVKADGNINPFDRQIAAFIAARNKTLTKHFQKFSTLPVGGVEYTLHLILLFARLQAQISPSPKPGLSAWAARTLRPFIKSINSDIRRDAVLRKLAKAVESGNIERILKEVDLQNNMNRDGREYSQAIKIFMKLVEGIRSLEAGADARRLAAQKYGHWLASIISIAALMTSMGLSYMYFLR